MAKATIILDGQTIEIETGKKAILETLLDAGHEPPFSCTSGVCTTCMAKLLDGEVEMDVNYGLDEDQVAQGYILTCQARPVSDTVKLSYDDIK